jgi:hypothetical protein
MALCRVSFPRMGLNIKTRFRLHWSLLKPTIFISILLVDETGVALSAQGRPFQITPADFQLGTAALGPTSTLRPPQVKMIDVFAAGIH